MELALISGFSIILLLGGVFLTYWSSRNLLSGTFISMGIWVLTFVGGLFFLFEEGHILTPLIIAVGAFFYGLGNLILGGLLRFKPKVEDRTF